MAHEIERKFLIRRPYRLELYRIMQHHSFQKFYITQTYLTPGTNDTERRVRQVTYPSGDYQFFYTEKQKITELDRKEVEKEISFKEAFDLLKEADPSLSPIEKTRYVFFYEGNKFEMDFYPFSYDYAILEIELPNSEHKFNLPKFLSIYCEVTDDKRYKNGYLASTLSFPYPN